MLSTVYDTLYVLTSNAMHLYDYLCIFCGGEEDEPLARDQSSDRVKLVRCRHCKNIVDPYVEVGGMIVALDCILLKLPAWRHTLVNAPSLENLQRPIRKSLLLLILLIFLELIGRIIVLGGIPTNNPIYTYDEPHSLKHFQLLGTEMFLRGHGISIATVASPRDVQVGKSEDEATSLSSFLHELWIGSLWDSELALDVDGPCARSFSCLGSGASDTYSMDLLAAAPSSSATPHEHSPEPVFWSNQDQPTSTAFTSVDITVSTLLDMFPVESRTLFPGSCRRILESKLPTLPILNFFTRMTISSKSITTQVFHLFALIILQILLLMASIGFLLMIPITMKSIITLIAFISKASLLRIAILFIPAAWPMPPVLSLFLGFIMLIIHFLTGLQALYRLSPFQSFLATIFSIGITSVVPYFLFPVH